MQTVEAHPAVGVWGAISQNCARGASQGFAAPLPRTPAMAALVDPLTPPWRPHPLAQSFLEAESGDSETNICPTIRSARRASPRISRVFGMAEAGPLECSADNDGGAGGGGGAGASGAADDGACVFCGLSVRR